MGSAPLGYVKYIYYDRKHLRIWADPRSIVPAYVPFPRYYDH